jgi:hypothetical protein
MAFYDDLLNSLRGTNIFGAGASQYIRDLAKPGGLISPEAIKEAESRSLAKGLLGGLATYIAQPKNQGYGSSLPYLGKAWASGMSFAQTPFDELEKGVATGAAIQKAGLEADKFALEKQKIERLRNNAQGLKNLPEVASDAYGVQLLDTDPEAGIKYFNDKFKVRDEKTTNLAKALAERDALDPNDPMFAQKKASYDEYIKNLGSKETIKETQLAGKQGWEYFTNQEKYLREDLSGAASAAMRSQETINDLRPILAEGKLYVGPGANYQQFLAKIGNKIGVKGANTEEKLANTAKAIQGLASSQLDAAQKLKGQGQISDKERELIQKAAMGEIGNDAAELTALMDAVEKVNRLTVEGYNKAVESVAEFAPEEKYRKNVLDRKINFKTYGGGAVKIKSVQEVK